MNSAKNNQPFRLAIGQLPITGDARQNSKWVKQTMRKAAAEGARLIQFPEGMLSGYAKNPIMDWSEVNWDAKARELRSIMRLAAQLKIWVVLGSAHPLTPPHWPHNSLYVISDAGELVTRYDKRIVSFTEVTKFYTPGYEPIVFEVDGYRFGCVICVEINFPELFIEYGNLDIDCLMFSAYPVDAIFDVKARAYAAVHNYWVSLATPSETSNFIQSSLIGPDGEYIARAEKAEDMVVADMNPSNPQLDIALNKARPWRKDVWTNPKYQTRGLNDPRSVNRTMI
ncbi:MAG TPA: carbon-nitrogen hydrolase family protein [Candidatus Saccharimonadales bacterium]|nr:carbon-nitrogen hydrolase family protein [Candidatus Saccharimonadales bacterium]